MISLRRAVGRGVEAAVRAPRQSTRSVGATRLLTAHSAPRDDLRSAPVNRVVGVAPLHSDTHTARALHTTPVHRSSADSEVPNLSFEDHLEIVSQHLDMLQRNNKFGQGLKKIRKDTDGKIVDRWNGAAAIYALSLAHCISPYGFTPDINSLQQYQEQQEKLCEKHEHGSDIFKFNRERLLVLAETAFGVTLPEESDVDLSTVRQVWGMLAMRMDTDEFEATVNKAFETLPSATGEEADAMKFQALQMAVLQLQSEVGDSFNMSGDDGFIKLQVAIMEQQTDDQIRYTASMAYHKAFGKFGLKLPGMGDN